MQTVKVTLLVRHPDNKDKLLVNFDPAILEVFREVQYLVSIGLEVPASAQKFYFKKSTLKEAFHTVQVLCNHDSRVVPYQFNGQIMICYLVRNILRLPNYCIKGAQRLPICVVPYICGTLYDTSFAGL